MENPVEQLKNSYRKQNKNSLRITGKMMQYYVLCEREVWLSYNQVPLETTNKHIIKGDLVDENTFKDEQVSTITIGGMIAPDILEDKHVLEIKPSSNITTGAEAQLTYYLWVFNEVLNKDKDGLLVIPPEKKRIEVEYDDTVKSTVENRIREITKIITDEEPPDLETKELCETCAFQDFCWIGKEGDTQ